MNTNLKISLMTGLLGGLFCISATILATSAAVGATVWMGPEFMVTVGSDASSAVSSPQGVAVAFRNTRQVAFYSPDWKLMRSTDLEGIPTGLTVNPATSILYVTTKDPAELLCINAETGEIVQKTSACPGACSPVFDVVRDVVYTPNRWVDSVSAYSADSLKPLCEQKVRRAPGSAVLDANRGLLYVANCLSEDPADGDRIHTRFSVLDVTGISKDAASAFALKKEIKMPSGFTDYHGGTISPDGNTVAFTHGFAKFFQGTFQVEWAWMNSSYLTLIDAETQKIKNILPLDDVIRGAANPWNVAWVQPVDGLPLSETMLVTHAGVHELSVIDMDQVRARMVQMGSMRDYTDQHELMKEGRERVLTEGNGPRAMVQMGTTVYVANFFSDTVAAIDLSKRPYCAKTIALNPDFGMQPEETGEMLFHDAMLCKQNWQSCIGCHPDGRADGFNWDLMNDGLDNFKNTKSLLYAHRTPPAMITGVRPHAEYAVRSGIRAILFTQPIEEHALAMDAYLKSLRPEPSPYLVNGELSPKAQRGKEIFQDPKVGCTLCHHGSLFTDMRLHDVGTTVAMDAPHNEWDTPTLIEVWRTAPYLHDGSACTVRDVLTTRNAQQMHGHTEHLSPEELDALAEYVLSL